jgi:tetratricopeptide (TPR) repeat protein
LRARGRWEEVVAEEPADEEAHRSLMRRHADAGNRPAALRQFERLKAALAEVGLQPGAETLALHENIGRGPAAVAPVPVRSPMVGRDSELAIARAAWRQASEGRGGVLMVSGEPGVGKTRLCEALLAEASSSWSTMRGAAREEEGPLPYAPIVEALDRLLAARPDLAFSLTSAAQAELARVTAASPAQPTDPEPRADRQRIFSSVAQVFARAAGERGAVLLLDDLHAADEATLQLVHYLARTARYQRLLIVMSFRDRPRISALDRARSGLFEQHLVASEIVLALLDREASRTIAEQVSSRPVAERTAEAIFGLARGNPFFTEELAATVDSKGAVEVPGRVYEILDSRLARLEPTLVGVLARIAIAGSEVTVDELSSLGPKRFEATQLEVLLAHSGDDWIGDVGLALQNTSHLPELARSVFDAHLCVSEYVLHSGQPYDELAVFARSLRVAADSSGARRGQAFAATVLGEIELLAGQLQSAEAQLREAVALSRLAGAAGGESLVLLRLAETTLERGDPSGAHRLLAESLELARFSPIGFHLLYLVYEVMVRAAGEPQEAVAVVEEAEAFLDDAPVCIFCPAGLYIAATIGYARTGDVARARSFLARAEGTKPLWVGGPRAAALAEARAAVLTAEGSRDEAVAALADAVAGFSHAGQVLNEARTRAALSGLL